MKRLGWLAALVGLAALALALLATGVTRHSVSVVSAGGVPGAAVVCPPLLPTPEATNTPPVPPHVAPAQPAGTPPPHCALLQPVLHVQPTATRAPTHTPPVPPTP